MLLEVCISSILFLISYCLIKTLIKTIWQHTPLWRNSFRLKSQFKARFLTVDNTDFRNLWWIYYGNCLKGFLKLLTVRLGANIYEVNLVDDGLDIHLHTNEQNWLAYSVSQADGQFVLFLHLWQVFVQYNRGLSKAQYSASVFNFMPNRQGGTNDGHVPCWPVQNWEKHFNSLSGKFSKNFESL